MYSIKDNIEKCKTHFQAYNPAIDERKYEYLFKFIDKKIIGNFGDDFPLWINLTGSVDGKPCIQLRYMLSIGTKHIRVIMNLNFINNEFEMYSINPKFGYSTDLRNDINPREEKCWDDFVNLIEYNQML